MHLKTLPIEHLQPAPYNPRVALQPGMPAYERLKRSLTEFELVQPLVWNEQSGYVVGGHQRLAVLKAEGVTEVPVVVVSLSEEREKALNVALNNQQVGGQWDVEKLQDLLKDLIELPDFDETLTGFSDQDLSDLLLTPEPEFPIDDDDKEDRVLVTLKIDPEDWTEIETRLDELLQEWDIELHVEMN